MGLLRWLKLMGIGGSAASLLSVAALWIDTLVRPHRDILFLDLSMLVYLVVAVVAFIGGMIVAIVLLISRSASITALGAIAVGITLSWGMIQGAMEVYRREDHFDAPMFYSDLLHISLNLLISPAVALLLWRISRERSRSLN